MAIVFVDVFFIYNFFINLILLLSTKLMCFAKSKAVNIVLGAGTGAFYAVCRMIFEISGLLAWIMDFICLACLVLISFFPTNFRDFFKNISVFFFVNFIYGGAMFFLVYFLNIGIHFGGGIFYVNIPVVPLILSTSAMYIFVYFTKRILERKILFSKRICKLEIEVANNNICVDALYDTGNSLFEPMSGAPVILIEENLLKEKNINISTYRFIPYKSTGGSGYLTAFAPDSIKINEKKVSVLVYVAIFSGILSKDGEYKAVLHPLAVEQINHKIKEACSVDI